ncbi:MAG: AraC family transcriptional regulator [Muribaculaceae bacterium]|nr:AraC family transcriptional regulator [Muribaculaceae bacterium]
MHNPNTKIITEITPLSEKDSFYLIDRYKDSFNYPIHRHAEFELNFVSHCSGARRVVGDSIEQIGDFDLVLVGNGIEHAWEQGECQSKRIREITLQFSRDLFGDSFLNKTTMDSIRKMLDRSSNGICFGLETIMRVYGHLDNITKMAVGFDRMIQLVMMLHELAESDDYRVLSSSSFTNAPASVDSRRVHKVQMYIQEHYKEEIRLNELAGLVGMSPTAFSRFFKLRTGRSISDYMIDIRLGNATRLLADSSMSVAEICYDCGFNNVSHFNRIFRKKKGCSPREFRETYKRHRILV